MPRPAECRKFRLEHVHFGALDELAMRQHARHGVVDGAAETATLRCHVNEGYRPLFDACVLIHVWPRALSSNEAMESADDPPWRLTLRDHGRHHARFEAARRNFKAGDSFFASHR